MLFAHSLPVEVLISRRAGVRARITLAVRVGGRHFSLYYTSADIQNDRMVLKACVYAYPADHHR